MLTRRSRAYDDSARSTTAHRGCQRKGRPCSRHESGTKTRIDRLGRLDGNGSRYDNRSGSNACWSGWGGCGLEEVVLLAMTAPAKAQAPALHGRSSRIGAPRAGPTSATIGNPLEVAREHMERGQGLYGAGRFIESAEEFLRAYEAQPFALFLFNAGVSYEKVGRPRPSGRLLRALLVRGSQAGDSRKVEQRIERLRGLSRAKEQENAAARQPRQPPTARPRPRPSVSSKSQEPPDGTRSPAGRGPLNQKLQVALVGPDHARRRHHHPQGCQRSARSGARRARRSPKPWMKASTRRGRAPQVQDHLHADQRGRR